MDSEIRQNYKVIQPLLIAACVSIGMMVGYKMNDRPQSSLISLENIDGVTDTKIGRIEEVIRFIESKYVDEINISPLTDAAIAGIFSQLDPHSQYISPQEVISIENDMNGFFFGIGVQITEVLDTIHVQQVTNGSAAFVAGLRQFDRIVACNDTIVTGKEFDLNRVSNMIQRNINKPIKLTIFREGAIKNFTLQAKETIIPNVSSKFLQDAQIAYIKIDKFGNDTYSDFMKEVEKYFAVVHKEPTKNQAKDLILDLRGNPGGYLPEAVNILSQIIEEKDVLLVYTEGRASKKDEYKSNGKRFYNIQKVVVLIDEQSASASEIVAGSIQDLDRGVIIGRRSYGKGLVQEQYPLQNRGAIRLTVSRYYTPSGRSIQREYSGDTYYDEDYYNRYLHGDLFYKDSTLVAKDTIFKTLNLGRKVSSKGGISPDYFIGYNTKFVSKDLFFAKERLDKFSYQYLATTGYGSYRNINEVFIKPLNKQVFESLVLFLSNESGGQLLSVENMQTITDEIKESFARVLFSNQEVAALLFDKDPYIIKSKELLTMNKTIAEILTAE